MQMNRIIFSVPGSKVYINRHYTNNPNSFINISLTGSKCQLMCSHCKALLLKDMVNINNFTRIDIKIKSGNNPEIKTEIKSNKVYKVIDKDSYFYICLDSEIKDKTLEELKLKKEDMLICLDEGLSDSKKKNLSIQCNLKVI